MVLEATVTAYLEEQHPAQAAEGLFNIPGIVESYVETFGFHDLDTVDRTEFEKIISSNRRSAW